jgi:hypothetical protein
MWNDTDTETFIIDPWPSWLWSRDTKRLCLSIGIRVGFGDTR